MRISVLASGSRGNAILVRSGKSSILFDLGVSVRKLKIRMAELGEDLSGLKAVFISHEHTDHIYGLEGFCKKRSVPVFATQGTLESWPMREIANGVAVKPGEMIAVDGFEVQAFRVPHDAAEPVGFIINDQEHRMALATDLGSSNALVQERLKNAEVVILESNHDPAMLREGPYPWPLKQRILGKYGHLSNQDCAKLLSKIQNHGLKKVVLAHLSDNNNLPELAFNAAREMVDDRIELSLSSQAAAGPVIEL